MIPDIVLQWIKKEEEVEGDKVCFFADFGVYRLWAEPEAAGWWEIQLTDRLAENILSTKHEQLKTFEMVKDVAVRFAADYFRELADGLNPRGAKGEIRFKSIIEVGGYLAGLSEDGLVYRHVHGEWTLLSSAPLLKAGE